ncbi:signal peptidase I [Actinoplanes sp. NEAU-A12]|uniref:Signal peptidase I n=1 Tax=Actinoplanes sandaracinus TaxID=3045177 RepID=A0ABT6WGX8_9ACTN|nr:signal peptidase I [Actinoplanes sandaracinus]MDI6098981.1 signal peptidase I [Actinoplanes sandaracinus]
MSTPTDNRRAGRPRWIEHIVLIAVAVTIAVVVRTFLVQTFWIPSPSMEPTLLRDDKVLVNKTAYRFQDPARGEIVVFAPPAAWSAEPGQNYIKRVIGVAGDHVVCCDRDRRITVNGRALDEDYLFPGDEPSDRPFDVTVGAGSVFVLGDHRSASADSREHLDAGGGAVGVDRLVGRAFVTFWPPGRSRTLSVPGTFAGVPDPR